MADELFITRKPKNQFLSPYISYYYFHGSKNVSFKKAFLYYPNIKSALTVYRGANVTFKGNQSFSKPGSDMKLSCYYSGMQSQLRSAEIRGEFDKIGVVFNQLGINHFMIDPLSKFQKRSADVTFNYFGASFENVCNQVFNSSSIDQKVNLLDTFFYNCYVGFENFKFKQIVHRIISSKNKLSVQDLSDEFEISKKSLLRLFNKHLCCSTKEYIDLVNFRKVLTHYLSKKQNQSLTQLAYDGNYYDQSQFINHFKKLSGKSPKDLFNNIKKFGEEDVFWTIK